jgi:hypothetical protein
MLNLLEKAVAHLSFFLYVHSNNYTIYSLIRKHSFLNLDFLATKHPWIFSLAKFFFINKEQDLLHNQITLTLIFFKPTF